MKKKFNFHGGGYVSKEEMNVIYMDDNTVVISDDDVILSVDELDELNKDKHEFDSGDTYWIFDKATGKCLNDSTTFGCFRTIDIA
jgi:hypothetical protein